MRSVRRSAVAVLLFLSFHTAAKAQQPSALETIFFIWHGREASPNNIVNKTLTEMTSSELHVKITEINGHNCGFVAEYVNVRTNHNFGINIFDFGKLTGRSRRSVVNGRHVLEMEGSEAFCTSPKTDGSQMTCIQNVRFEEADAWAIDRQEAAFKYLFSKFCSYSNKPF